ncbi:hypothetical protein Droror1_Dr00016057 [Drosera rotundifolia]
MNSSKLSRCLRSKDLDVEGEELIPWSCYELKSWLLWFDVGILPVAARADSVAELGIYFVEDFEIDGDGQVSKAEKMLAKMVQASMQRSLRHLQERGLVCILADHQAPDEVPSK